MRLSTDIFTLTYKRACPPLQVFCLYSLQLRQIAREQGERKKLYIYIYEYEVHKDNGFVLQGVGWIPQEPLYVSKYIFRYVHHSSIATWTAAVILLFPVWWLPTNPNGFTRRPIWWTTNDSVPVGSREGVVKIHICYPHLRHRDRATSRPHALWSKPVGPPPLETTGCCMVQLYLHPRNEAELLVTAKSRGRSTKAVWQSDSVARADLGMGMICDDVSTQARVSSWSGRRPWPSTQRWPVEFWTQATARNTHQHQNHYRDEQKNSRMRATVKLNILIALARWSGASVDTEGDLETERNWGSRKHCYNALN